MVVGWWWGGEVVRGVVLDGGCYCGVVYSVSSLWCCVRLLCGGVSISDMLAVVIILVSISQRNPK